MSATASSKLATILFIGICPPSPRVYYYEIAEIVYVNPLYSLVLGDKGGWGTPPNPWHPP
jgi:hypothetical protein